MSMLAPLADDARLDDDNSLDFGDILTCGAPDPCLELKADFNQGDIPCKQVGVATLLQWWKSLLWPTQN